MQSLLDHSDHRELGLFRLVSGNWRAMAGAFSLGVCLTLAYFSLAPRKFQSEAKLLVRIGHESVSLDPTATTGAFMAVADSRGSEAYAVEELLTSRQLAEQVVEHIGDDAILRLEPGERGSSLGERLSWLNQFNLNPLRVFSIRDKALKAFQEDLRVSTGSKTNVVSISFECHDPQLAREVTRYLLRTACDEHLRVHRTRGSQEFFIGQSELFKTELARLEDQLRDFKNQTKVSSLATQRDIKLQLIGSLTSDLVRAEAERDSVLAELERRRQQLKELPTLSVSEQTIGQPHSTDQTLREKLYDLEIKEQELAARFTMTHPQRTEIRNQLAEARRIYELEKQPVAVKTALNQAHQAAELAVQEREALLIAVTARVGSLREKIAAVDQEIQKLNDVEVTFNRLEREIDITRASGRKYLENMEQARINQELEEAKISSLSVLEEPTFSETPVSPRPVTTFVVGLVASAMLSLAVAARAQQQRSRRQGDPDPQSASAVMEDDTKHSLARQVLSWREEAPSRPR